MKYSFLLFVPISFFISGCGPSPEFGRSGAPEPPVAETREHVVRAPGGERVDPYYWLRDDRREDPQVIALLEAENAYRDAMLAHLEPFRALLVEEMRGRIAEDHYERLYEENGYWYYTRFEAGLEYPIHGRRKGSMEAEEEVLIDANQLARDHDFFRIGGLDVSPDGQRLAWLQDTVGRRQYQLMIRDLTTGKLTDPGIAGVSSVSWASDGESLFYVRNQPGTLRSWQVWRHWPGRGREDELLHQEDDASFYTWVGRTGSGRYNYVYLRSTISSEMRVIDSAEPGARLRVFLPRQDHHEYSADHAGGRWVVRSNFRAPNFRLLTTGKIEHASPSELLELVAHDPEVFIEDFAAFEDYVAIGERSGGLKRIRILDLAEGQSRLVEFDESAYTAALGINRDPASGELQYLYTSLTTPPSTWLLDLAGGEQRLLQRQEIPGGFDPADYVSFRTWAEARDGTRIPVTLLHHADTPLDGSAPLYQYGYGSYGASSDPTFNASRMSLVDRGFVFAIAHVRGGQELGRDWYDQGRLRNKMNTFTDFIDVTDHLVESGLVDGDRVFAMGGSAGGLLVGAVANLAPEKYAGIIAHVPFVDVVTTMLDESIPLTTNEYDEWGDPSDPEFYDYMLTYSPYDNVAEQDYPAMLVTTGLWDSQVQYWEPAKWVARLRATRTDDNPLILHTNMAAGHGGQSGRYRRLEQSAMEYAFVLDLAGLAE